MAKDKTKRVASVAGSSALAADYTPPADWAPAAHGLPEDFADDRQFATTLARGLELLHCFTPRDTQLGNAELSSRTGMPKATVSRFTYTLVRMGYLRINRISGKYQLGPAVLSLGYPLLASLSIRQTARAFMKDLADSVRGSVSLGMRDRLNVVYIESSRGDTARDRPPDVGLSYPIARTAMGRALLAACPREERDALINEIKVKTPQDWTVFHRQIADGVRQCQEQGYCVSHGDLRREIHAVAAPMRPMADGTILVFNCGISAFLLSEGQMTRDIAPRLVSMVRSVESMLGLY